MAYILNNLGNDASDPYGYSQDPRCPEGKITAEGDSGCIDDPAYIDMMERMSQELRDLEEQERKIAQQAKIDQAREKLRIEQEARRLRVDEQRRLQRIAEEEQVQMLATYAIVGLGVLITLTLVVKLVL